MRDSFNKVAAIHFAAFKGHNTIVDFLLKKGARVSIADKRGTLNRERFTHKKFAI